MKAVVNTIAAAGLALAANAAVAQAPAPPTATAATQNPIDVALAASKNFAGFDFTGTLARLCIAPQTGPGADVLPSPNAPPRSSWYADPAKVFDNLYFVGGALHSAWALVGNQGIILIDTIYDYNSEELIIGGMQKLGLDPKQIKYVVITHAHGDHIGGAKMLQDRYGARIVMGEPDWKFVEESQFRFGQGDKSIKPKRDMVALDGMKITLGDISVTLLATPGHTPGTTSLSFQVKDFGKTLNVAYSGGTAFNFVNTPENFETYIQSQLKMGRMVEDTKATVLMSNHSEFDNAVTKIKLMAARKQGEPSPFELGQETVARYFKVSEGCARVAQMKLLEKK
jgi:metallo-beta-lactamase class B